MENSIELEAVIQTEAPTPALPDAKSARETVGRWLRNEVGYSLYPGEPAFLAETFAWHVPIWLSTAEQPSLGIVADVYLNAATGHFWVALPEKSSFAAWTRSSNRGIDQMLPVFNQEVPTSCVPACVRMVLTALRVLLTEAEILARCGGANVGLRLNEVSIGLQDLPVVVERHLDWSLDDLRDAVGQRCTQLWGLTCVR